MGLPLPCLERYYVAVTLSQLSYTCRTFSGLAPAPNSHCAKQPPFFHRLAYTSRTALSIFCGVPNGSNHCRSISPQNVILPLNDFRFSTPMQNTCEFRASTPTSI